MKPILKWAGGKRWLVGKVKAYWTGEHILVEPFAGGAAIALGLDCKQAILADNNAYLIGFYQAIKQYGNNILNVGLLDSGDYQNEKTFYYYVRDQFNAKHKPRDFYYLNRMGFNGLCRFNKQGVFNVPYGKYKQQFKWPDFQPYKEQFKDWKFLISDFSKLIPTLEKHHFIYADPPYADMFDGYSGKDFTGEQQEHLAYLLSQHSGPVVASNISSPTIAKIYKQLGFQIYEVHKRHSVGAKAESRKVKTELFMVKNLL